MDDYETKNHFDTLMRAEEIKADPVKMKKLRKLLPRHKRAIKSIQDIKDIRDEKYGPGAMQDSDDDNM